MPKKKDEWTEESWQAEDNAWYQKARQTAEALLDRPDFRYDPDADPLYRAARDQYARQGRRAMEDTLGRTAALSGGYYYDRARSAYDKETGALRDALGTAIGLYDKDYQVWLDRQSARERRVAAETKQDQWEREFAEDHQRWTAEFDREAEQLAAQQAAAAAGQARSDAANERSYAYRMAMLALQQGLRVSDALLQTAGIDKAYAETIRRYYAAQH